MRLSTKAMWLKTAILLIKIAINKIDRHALSCFAIRFLFKC